MCNEDKTKSSLDLAYELAIRPSIVLQRITNLNSLLLRLATIAVGSPLGISVLARDLCLSIGTTGMTLIWGIALLTMIGCIIAHSLMSSTRVLTLEGIYKDEWLKLEPAKFKDNMIYYLSEAEKENEALLNKKYWVSLAAGFLIVVEFIVGVLYGYSFFRQG